MVCNIVPKREWPLPGSTLGDPKEILVPSLLYINETLTKLDLLSVLRTVLCVEESEHQPSMATSADGPPKRQQRSGADSTTIRRLPDSSLQDSDSPAASSKEACEGRNVGSSQL